MNVTSLNKRFNSTINNISHYASESGAVSIRREKKSDNVNIEYVEVIISELIPLQKPIITQAGNNYKEYFLLFLENFKNLHSTASFLILYYKT
jgi:hypothetical protein